ncbi:hypothetical protein GCM10010451_02300 [Streptomyces virens]|uniref:Uncharacterized protein n=1 Tax=Streptomyces virens TaxID=285572 RepID=A0ABP6NV80_9ACTN
MEGGFGGLTPPGPAENLTHRTEAAVRSLQERAAAFVVPAAPVARPAHAASTEEPRAVCGGAVRTRRTAVPEDARPRLSAESQPRGFVTELRQPGYSNPSTSAPFARTVQMPLRRLITPRHTA